MSKYLLDEHPLIVIPKLAVAVGLNEAIVLQQVNYWLNKSTKVFEGKKWTYNSYEDWQKQLPFWSISTIKRIFTGLEKDGLLVSGNFNKAKFDKTKWYTIDSVKLTSRVCQIDTTEKVKLNQPIPDTSSDTSSDTSLKTYSPAKAEQFDWKAVIDYLNKKAHKNFKHVNGNKKWIVARFNDGYTLEDMKKVIDNQCRAWKGKTFDGKPAENYLRPETLFRPSKIESYLNQESVEKTNVPTGREWF